MIRFDIESLYFMSNGEVSIQVGLFCVYFYFDGICFIKLYNWNNWLIYVQIV